MDLITEYDVDAWDQVVAERYEYIMIRYLLAQVHNQIGETLLSQIFNQEREKKNG